MRLVKCKKCGTPIMMDSYIVEQMFIAMQECNEKARKSKNNIDKMSYLQEAKQISKMITQIQHRTTQIEERKTTYLCQLSALVHYIRENNLISDDVLSEIKDTAREQARIKNEADTKVIKRIYGEFENTMTNRSVKDTTANKALKNVK